MKTQGMSGGTPAKDPRDAGATQEGRASLAWLFLFAVVALAVLPVALLFGADITPGYIFSSGEANVTHTKVNNATAGTINSTFYSGKSSAGANPTPGNYTFLGLDSVSGLYKRATLDVWVFDHSGLLADRTIVTTPSLAYTHFINDGGAYKQISTTNLLYGGGNLTSVDGNVRFGAVLAGGAMTSLNLSNLFAGAAVHTTPTNGDLLLVLTENGRAVKAMTQETLFKLQTVGTNFTGTDRIVTWDGTRLRTYYATSLVDSVTSTNNTPTTNDAWTVLQDGALKKVFAGVMRDFMHRGSLSMTQTVYSAHTNINSGGAWTTITNLVATITPRSTSSKVLVRVVLTACASGNSQPAMMRGLKTTGGDVPLGVGASDASARTEASSPIVNATEPTSVVFEYLDSPAYASNLTYTAQVLATASTIVYINQTASDANNANNIRGVSTITLTEVYQ